MIHDESSRANSPLPTEHDREEANEWCDVDTNNEVQIRLKVNTSNDDRYDNKNIMRTNLVGDGSIMEYLMLGITKVAYEELYSTNYEKHIYDQHVRFFIDLDKVLTLNHKVIKTFLKYFAETFLQVIDEHPDDMIQISHILSVDEIVQGARVAVKSDKKKLGIHIYFTNIITHAMNFHNLASVIRKVRTLGILHLHNLGHKGCDNIENFKQANLDATLTTEEHAWAMFLCLDTGLYNNKPNLRCIYSLKTEDKDVCTAKCLTVPCKHTTRSSLYSLVR